MVDLRLCCCGFGWCIVVWFVLVFVACDFSGLVVLVYWWCWFSSLSSVFSCIYVLNASAVFKLGVVGYGLVVVDSVVWIWLVWL